MKKMFIFLFVFLSTVSINIYGMDDDEYSYVDNYYEEKNGNEFVQVKNESREKKDSKVEESYQYNLDIKDQVNFEFKSSRVTIT